MIGSFSSYYFIMNHDSLKTGKSPHMSLSVSIKHGFLEDDGPDEQEFIWPCHILLKHLATTPNSLLV
jgi:hypothetical protein